MKRSYIYTALALLSLSFSFAGTYHLAEIQEDGYFNCFPADFPKYGKIANLAATSACAFDGHNIYVANDKPIITGNASPVFSITLPIQPHQPKDSPTYHTHNLLKSTRKIEAMTVTPDRSHVILSTGFSSVGEVSRPNDYYYNRMLTFPANQPHLTQVAEPEKNFGITHSSSIRKNLRQALSSHHSPLIPYINAEAIATIPDPESDSDILLFGIRQMGEDYDNHQFVAKILYANYKITQDQLTFTSKIQQLYEFFPTAHLPNAHNMGISGLAYDPSSKLLYILTSFENSDSGDSSDIGAYLWALPLSELLKSYQGHHPHLTHSLTTLANKKGLKPLKFTHKMEGITVLSPGKLFLVADDDYILGPRKRHQAYYAIVNVSQFTQEGLTAILNECP